jgi:hypothetical protein
MNWGKDTWRTMAAKPERKYKKSEKWKPYGDVQMGDHTDVGVVVKVEQDLGNTFGSTKCGTMVYFDREDGDGFKQRNASMIKHNYSRLRRQIMKLLTASEMAPSRKTAIRDLSKFWEIDKQEAMEMVKDSSYLREQDERLSRFEKSVVTRKTSDKFGI